MKDFTGMGIDALNPVQVSARNMEPARLKREFGGRIVFWRGLDTQKLLPFGAADEVRAEVRRLFGVPGAGGGYVLALFEEGRACRYA